MRRAGAGLLAAAVVVLGGCGKTSAPAPQTSVPTPPPARRVVPPVVPVPRAGQTLVAAVRVKGPLRASPGGRVLAHAGPRTAFGSPQVLAVLGVSGDWVHVLHPGLPDRRGGWVALRNVALRPAAWAIDVDLSTRRAELRRNGRVFRTFAVGIGAPGTSTPAGRYGVTDRLSAGRSNSYYGCCVIALTGHQPNVPQRWQGGDRLAIHGTDAPATIGAAATLGCLHADDATMRVLVSRVPLGTQVTIHA